jgi:limonene-1,2-epoxide hydrolase
MGTIVVDNNQITVWRDYFDPADFDRQLAKVKAIAPCVTEPFRVW